MRGEVIGINTAIASRSGSYSGIGFAMPMNTAAVVYNEIIKSGKVTRGSIGIRFNQSDNENTVALLKSMGADAGVYVSEVVPGGPSSKAGLKPKDVILAVNGKPVRVGDDLVNIVTATPIGDSVTLTVLRDGKRDTYKVVVGNMAQIFPDDTASAGQPEPVRPEATAVSFGMTIVPLTERQRESMNLKEKVGVRVAEVEPNSFADDIRLQTGDVIIAVGYAVNGRPVTQSIATIEDLKKVQSNLKVGDSIRFDIMQRRSPRSSEWVEGSRAGTITSALR